MFLLKSRIRNLNLPIYCQLKHFDHTVLPILLYGCEIWGFENDAITGIENVHTRFLQSILELNVVHLYIWYMVSLDGFHLLPMLNLE